MSGRGAAMPPAMILCGGQGTRIRDVTELLPKPMVPIGPYPILWHIMRTYAAFGVDRFILCLGYKREAIVDFFVNYPARTSDLTVRLGRPGDVVYHDRGERLDWQITLADTGDRTMTGARVARAARYLLPTDDVFFLTYGDGVANVDLAALLAQHRARGRALTVTAVHPAGRFGEIQLAGDEVSGFHEKPQTGSGLINGGYMAVSRRFLERYLTSDPGLVLEQEPMQGATRDRELAAYVHHGYWQCMDTAREHQQLNQLWDAGKAPWTEAW